MVVTAAEVNVMDMSVYLVAAVDPSDMEAAVKVDPLTVGWKTANTLVDEPSPITNAAVFASVGW